MTVPTLELTISKADITGTPLNDVTIETSRRLEMSHTPCEFEHVSYTHGISVYSATLISSNLNFEQRKNGYKREREREREREKDMWLVLLQPSITEVTSSAPSQAAQPTQTSADAPAPARGVCTRSGYVRDPSNCQVFYICENVSGQYEVNQFTCPAGTVFDTTINVCNYPEEVQC
jgi:hypothetical protein